VPVVATSRRGYRIAAREIPGPWLAAGALVALALLLFAFGGPLRPSLATFGIGLVVALAFVWLHGAVARRRAEAQQAAVLAEGLARLATQGGLAADLALLTRPAPGTGSLAACAREAAAAARARDVHVAVVVEQDTVVRTGVGRALRAALGAVPPGSSVELAVRSGRVELRGAGGPPADQYPVELARALVQRERGHLDVFADDAGTLTVLTLPAR